MLAYTKLIATKLFMMGMTLQYCILAMYGHVETCEEPTSTSVSTESNVESGSNDNSQGKYNTLLQYCRFCRLQYV